MKILKQESDTSCGIACLRSIFNEFDLKVSENDIIKKCSFFNLSNGVLNPIISLGVSALNFGFKVEYYGFNPIIANNLNKKNLVDSLKFKSSKYHDFGKFIVDKTLEFIELNGKYHIVKLDIKKLKSLIKKYNFILVEIKPSYIFDNTGANFIHKVIVDSFNKNSFHILDPSSGSGKYVKFNDFLMAFYATAPEVLIIKK